MTSRALLIFAALLAGGCSAGSVKGDGVIKTEQTAVTQFTAISVSGDFEVEWISGAAGLRITGDQNLLSLIEVTSGDVLRIKATKNLQSTGPIKLAISSPALTELQAAGDIRFRAAGIAGESLKIMGAGNVAFTLAGAVNSLTVSVTGDGKLDARDLVTKSTDLSIIGDGRADVTATVSLKVSVIGDGSCTYGGNPAKVEKSGIGGNNVRPRS